MTTAARTRDLLRRLGWRAEVVEHRRGRFLRVDLFGFADVEAFRPHPPGILLVQAYQRGKERQHVALTPQANKAIRDWVLSGGMFWHVVWYPPAPRRGRRTWEAEIVPYGLVGPLKGKRVTSMGNTP